MERGEGVVGVGGGVLERGFGDMSPLTRRTLESFGVETAVDGSGVDSGAVDTGGVEEGAAVDRRSVEEPGVDGEGDGGDRCG